MKKRKNKNVFGIHEVENLLQPILSTPVVAMALENAVGIARAMAAPCGQYMSAIGGTACRLAELEAADKVDWVNCEMSWEDWCSAVGACIVNDRGVAPTGLTHTQVLAILYPDAKKP